MALDKLTIINNGGLSTTSDYRVGVLTATKFVGPIESNSATFNGSVSIGGTLTYEDVTNIDSVGIITARNGIDCNGDITCTSDLILDSTNTDYPRITLHSNATGIRKYGIINGQAWNQDALLIYDLDSDNTRLTIEPNGLGINRGANSLSHTLDVGGTAMIRGNTEITGDLDVDGHTNLDNVSIAGVTTTSAGLNLGGDLVIPSSGHNLKIWTGGTQGIIMGHGGTFGEIDNLTGMMRIKAGQIKLSNRFGNLDMLTCNSFGSVDLFHNNILRFTTTGYGVSTTGLEVVGVSTFSDDVAIRSSNPLILSNASNNASCQVLCDGGARLHFKSYSQTMATFENGQPIIFYTDSGQNRLQISNNGNVSIAKDLNVDGHTNLDNVSIAGVSTFSDNVSFTTANGNGIIISKSGNYMAFGNSVTQYFGGTSMWLQHNGSTGYLHNVTGGLYVRNEANNGHIYIQGKSGANSIIAKYEGAVELYHNASKKIETTTSGATVTGTLAADGISVGNGEHISLGNSNQFKLYHDGSNAALQTTSGNTYLYGGGGNFLIRPVNAEQGLNVIANGAVELFHNDVKVCTTTTEGIRVQGAEGGGGKLEIYADEGDDNADKWHLLANTDGTLLIRNLSDGSWDTNIRLSSTKTELFYDDTPKLETSNTGVIVAGNVTANHSNGQVKLQASDGSIEITKTAGGAYIDFKNDTNEDYDCRINEEGGHLRVNTHFRLYDNKALELGNRTSSTYGDLRLFHDASDSYIQNYTGVFYIKNTGDLRIKVDDTDAAIHCVRNGTVELYHSGTKKIETTSTGLSVTGNIQASGHAAISGTPANYRYGRGNEPGGLSVYAAEGAIEVVSTEDSTHGSSLLLRTVDDGAGFVYNSTDNALELKLFTPSADNFSIHGGGTNLSSLDTQLRVVKDAAVELYHNGSKKLETVSGGIQVNGQVYATNTGSTPAFSCTDNGRSSWGSSDDLVVYHSSSNAASYIQNSTGNLFIEAPNSSAVKLRKKGTSDTMIVATAGGSVELYFNNSKKFETNNGGTNFHGTTHTITTGDLYPMNDNTIRVGLSNRAWQQVNTYEMYIREFASFLDNMPAKFGNSDDLSIYHSASDNNSFIDSNRAGSQILIRTKEAGGTTNNAAKFLPTGAVELYFDGSKKFETNNEGIVVSGDFLIDMANGYSFWIDQSGNKVKLGDSIQLQLGNTADLSLYHDGSHSYIKNTTNYLYHYATQHHFANADGSQLQAIFKENAGVELYHSGTKRIETTNHGIRTNGHLIYMGPNNITNFVHSGGNISLTADTNMYFVVDSNDTSGDAPAGEFRWGGGSNTNTDSNQDFTFAEFGNNGQPRNEYMFLDETQLKINSSIKWYSNNNFDIGTNATKNRRIYAHEFIFREGNNPSGSITGGGGSASREVIKFSSTGFTVHHDNVVLSTAAAFSSLTGTRSTDLFRLRNNGTGAAIYSESGSISSASDYRIKENVVGITSAISTVKTLNPVSYNIKKSWNPEDDGVREHGFLAHEVAESIPNIKNIATGSKDAVNGDGTIDAQGMDYGRMTPVLTAAIKELIAKVETLEAEVAALKGS